MQEFTDRLYDLAVENLPVAIAIAALGDIMIIAIIAANI
jgi:hypothetical protein